MEIRSPLRYPGGKFKAMPQIMPHIPANVKDWREPFFGGGSVTLYYLQRCLEGETDDMLGQIRRVPETITVGDFNPEIWAFWVGCRDKAGDAALEVMNIMAEFNELYYKPYTGLDFLIYSESSEKYREYNKVYAPRLDSECSARTEEIKGNLERVYNEFGVSSSEYSHNDLYNIVAKSRGDVDVIKKELGELNLMTDKNTEFTVEVCKRIFDRAKAAFEKFKNIDKENESIAWRCARQFVINRVSFSGMGDAGTLSKDQFMDFKMHDVKKLVEVSPLLTNVEIKNVSFEEIMRMEPQGTATPDEVYIFLDPPYLTQESSGLYGKDGEMHLGFPHQLFVDECKKSPYKFLVTYDDSTQVRRMFKGLKLKPFKLVYTMAGKTSEDALAGEELFIANFELDRDEEDAWDTNF